MPQRRRNSRPATAPTAAHAPMPDEDDNLPIGLLLSAAAAAAHSPTTSTTSTTTTTTATATITTTTAAAIAEAPAMGAGSPVAPPVLARVASAAAQPQPQQDCERLLIDDEAVSLAVAVRLRDAAGEYVRLDELVSQLLPSEFQVRAVAQKVDHLAAELRGAENERTYLNDKHNRDWASLNSTFLSRAKKADIADVVAVTKTREQAVVHRIERLTQELQSWTAKKAKLESDVRMLMHVRSRREALFERVFNGTEIDFPAEGGLRMQVRQLETVVAAYADSLSKWEAARTAIQRIETALTEKWHKLQYRNRNFETSDQDSAQVLTDCQAFLVNAKALYQEVCDIQPGLPPLPATFDSRVTGSKNTLLGQFVIQVQDFGRVVYDIRAVQGHVHQTISGERLCLKDAQSQLKSTKAQLMRERTRILQSAVLARDRERARRVEISQEVSNPHLSVHNHDDDLPPPYSPPGYHAALSFTPPLAASLLRPDHDACPDYSAESGAMLDASLETSREQRIRRHTHDTVLVQGEHSGDEQDQGSATDELTRGRLRLSDQDHGSAASSAIATAAVVHTLSTRTSRPNSLLSRTSSIGSRDTRRNGRRRRTWVTPLSRVANLAGWDRPQRRSAEGANDSDHDSISVHSRNSLSNISIAASSNSSSSSINVMANRNADQPPPSSSDLMQDSPLISRQASQASLHQRHARVNSDSILLAPRTGPGSTGNSSTHAIYSIDHSSSVGPSEACSSALDHDGSADNRPDAKRSKSRRHHLSPLLAISGISKTLSALVTPPGTPGQTSRLADLGKSLDSGVQYFRSGRAGTSKRDMDGPGSASVSASAPGSATIPMDPAGDSIHLSTDASERQRPPPAPSIQSSRGSSVPSNSPAFSSGTDAQANARQGQYQTYQQQYQMQQQLQAQQTIDDLLISDDDDVYSVRDGSSPSNVGPAPSSCASAAINYQGALDSRYSVVLPNGKSVPRSNTPPPAMPTLPAQYTAGASGSSAGRSAATRLGAQVPRPSSPSPMISLMQSQSQSQSQPSEAADGAGWTASSLDQTYKPAFGSTSRRGRLANANAYSNANSYISTAADDAAYSSYMATPAPMTTTTTTMGGSLGRPAAGGGQLPPFKSLRAGSVPHTSHAYARSNGPAPALGGAQATATATGHGSQAGGGARSHNATAPNRDNGRFRPDSFYSESSKVYGMGYAAPSAVTANNAALYSSPGGQGSYSPTSPTGGSSKPAKRYCGCLSRVVLISLIVAASVLTVVFGVLALLFVPRGLAIAVVDAPAAGAQTAAGSWTVLAGGAAVASSEAGGVAASSNDTARVLAGAGAGNLVTARLAMRLPVRLESGNFIPWTMDTVAFAGNLLANTSGREPIPTGPLFNWTGSASGVSVAQGSNTIELFVGRLAAGTDAVHGQPIDLNWTTDKPVQLSDPVIAALMAYCSATDTATATATSTAVAAATASPTPTQGSLVLSYTLSMSKAFILPINVETVVASATLPCPPKFAEFLAIVRDAAARGPAPSTSTSATAPAATTTAARPAPDVNDAVPSVVPPRPAPSPSPSPARPPVARPSPSALPASPAPAAPAGGN
ncbi:hypothetical protein BC831DRAFT_505013 [Entophlyctis helioformis]|nr:hypothetical protein BC831DRAFT_505013 [Entophlyctis helioformis]